HIDIFILISNILCLCKITYTIFFHHSSCKYVAVQVGDDVTFHCFHPKDQLNRVMWFKQTLGEKPVLVASSYHWTQKSVLYDDFEKSKRFRVGAGIGSFNLTIQKTAQSDSATYYCAVSFSNVVYFGAGTNLVIRGEIHILQQPTSSGGNVTLLCTIQNEQESCGGDHKVYWFRHGLGKSHPGIIYTQGSCKNSSMAVSPTKSCVYSLSLRNIKPSDAGTYYCAVVTCTEILFGHGINLASDGESVEFYLEMFLNTVLVSVSILLYLYYLYLEICFHSQESKEELVEFYGRKYIPK
uniref:Uncharacterized LOC107679245 n=1 Tax=Sinocyclocheilus anshuiensis TaxID=1608454 RepID=A0A671N2E8_9TELE